MVKSDLATFKLRSTTISHLIHQTKHNPTQKKSKRKLGKGKKKIGKMSASSILWFRSMSLVSQQPFLRQSSRTEETKHVVVYYTEHDDGRLVGRLTCLQVETLLSKDNLPCKRIELLLPSLETERKDLNELTSCICTTNTSVRGPSLFAFGGLDPLPGKNDWKHILDTVYRYDFHKLAKGKVGSIKRVSRMKFGAAKPLLTQIGDDNSIYVLCHGKMRDDDVFRPAFQKYNLKRNSWSLPDNENFVDMIHKSDSNKIFRYNLGTVPHVVIDGKFHISVGNSAFTFDTNSSTWKDCELFKHFWSKQKKKETGLSPLDFFGKEVWCDEKAKKKWGTRKRNTCGGPPLGFHGQGILWGKNILLGIRYAINCPLVAFLLDDKSRTVVKSQRISLDNLVSDCTLARGARLIDLGQGGFFGLINTPPDDENFDYFIGPYARMELVIFQVEKAGDDNDDFLKCRVVRTEIVDKALPGAIGKFYDAFCV